MLPVFTLTQLPIYDWLFCCTQLIIKHFKLKKKCLTKQEATVLSKITQYDTVSHASNQPQPTSNLTSWTTKPFLLSESEFSELKNYRIYSKCKPA
jgi:hypothetical protein